MGQIQSYLNRQLHNQLTSALSEHKIPYTSDVTSLPLTDEFLVTFFIINQDIHLPQKNSTKFRLNHPEVKLAFSLLPIFNYEFLVSQLYADTDEHKKFIKEHNNELILKDFAIFYTLLDPTFASAIISTITRWTKNLFHAAFVQCKEKYDMKLAILPVQIYVSNPETMCITKFPDFEDLIFYTNSKKAEKVDIQEFIKEQEDILKHFPPSSLKPNNSSN